MSIYLPTNPDDINQESLKQKVKKINNNWKVTQRVIGSFEMEKEREHEWRMIEMEKEWEHEWRMIRLFFYENPHENDWYVKRMNKNMISGFLWQVSVTLSLVTELNQELVINASP